MNIRRRLEQPADSKLFRGQAIPALGEGLLGELRDNGYDVHEGKVRQCVSKDDVMWMFHGDRLTAFDRLIDLIPSKGQILACINYWWLQETKKECPNHLISAVNGRTLAVKKLEPLAVEVVVRGYMAGSMQRAYLQGEREFCGQRLEEGLQPWQALPTPILTPTTKAAAFEHDENTDAHAIVHKQKLCSEEDWQTVSSRALELYRIGAKIYREKGWILADTKYEFGRDANGNWLVMDEIHTPDSSRLWRIADWKNATPNRPPVSEDKDLIRHYLTEKGFTGKGDVPPVPQELLVRTALAYLDVAECLYGHELELDDTLPPWETL